MQEIALSKQSNETLGIRINGGLDGKRMNPDDPDDDGIFVTEVGQRTPSVRFPTLSLFLSLLGEREQPGVGSADHRHAHSGGKPACDFLSTVT